MTMLSPGPFRNTTSQIIEQSVDQYLQQANYQYASNGVRIFVEHNQYLNNMPGMKEARGQIHERLQGMTGLELVGLDEATISQNGLVGTKITARCLMMPFAKQMIYQIKLLMQDNNLWLVTASYKECDTAGKQLVSAIMDSISVNNTP